MAVADAIRVALLVLKIFELEAVGLTGCVRRFVNLPLAVIKNKRIADAQLAAAGSGRLGTDARQADAMSLGC